MLSPNAQVIKAKYTQKKQLKLQVSETKPESDHEEQKLRSKELKTTPKPGHGFDVHNTTILEENETMRGSIDKHPALARK